MIALIPNPEAQKLAQIYVEKHLDTIVNEITYMCGETPVQNDRGYYALDQLTTLDANVRNARVLMDFANSMLALAATGAGNKRKLYDGYTMLSKRIDSDDPSGQKESLNAAQDDLVPVFKQYDIILGPSFGGNRGANR